MVNEQFKKLNNGQTKSETNNRSVSDQLAAKNTQSHVSRFSYVLVTLDTFGNKTDNLSKWERSAEIQYSNKDLWKQFNYQFEQWKLFNNPLLLTVAFICYL